MACPGTAWRDAMRRGDFAAAWAVNDRVLAGRDPGTCDDPGLPYHLRWVWDGTGPDGRDVLVRCYHGLGDTLQFSRFLPLLAARAAGLTVEAQPELVPLLAASGIAARWVPFRPDAPLPPAACTLEIMEAGHVLRHLPPPALPPSPRPPRAGVLRAGLCTSGGDWDPGRWVPDGSLGVLAALSGVCWTSLRPRRSEGVRGEGVRGEGVRGEGAGDDGPFGPGLPPGGSVADTAALLAGLDLVVTVDTMVAHLAGSLGVPTWVLLKAEPDWRWLPRGRRSPWYPSARLYRQEAPGEWQPVLREVARDLALAQSGGAEELGPTNDGKDGSVPMTP